MPDPIGSNELRQFRHASHVLTRLATELLQAESLDGGAVRAALAAATSASTVPGASPTIASKQAFGTESVRQV